MHNEFPFETSNSYLLKPIIPWATTQSQTRTVLETLSNIDSKIDIIRNPNFRAIVQTPNSLTTETVEGPALPLESVDNVHGSDGLAASVLGVGDSVANHVLEKDLENTTGFFVYETTNTFNATTSSETANRGFGDSLNVIPQNLTVSFGTSLSEPLATLSSSRHG